ncbi:hypothetical protein [Kitasatospora sp. NBC_01539]|uniref:hypothetical protein n=1 Tax=Kitasatospora sp. NBC_01539 TaxID=2903577 RepID=UPI00386019C8
MALLTLLLIALAALAVLGGIALARRGRALDRAAADAALARAAARTAAGRHEQARRRYARLVERLALAPPALRPQRGLALLGQAGATAAGGDPAASLPLYREAFPLLAEPDRQLPPWCLAQLADEAVQAGGTELAPVLALLRHARTPGGGSDSATRLLDWLQRRCREGTPAERDTATAAALAALPGQDWPVLARAALLHDTGRAAEAEAVLLTAAPHGSGELWFRRGARLSTAGRHDEAVAAFDEALRRGPGEPSPWSRGPALRAESLLFRGLARQRLGRPEAADADLRAAAAEAPADARPPYALGRLALLAGADDEARTHFTAALAADPASAPARLGLALLHERAGRPAEAAADYRAALAARPGWQPAQVRLGAALLAAGQPGEAEPLLAAQAGADSPWGRSAAFHLGLARARAGDPAGALARWEPLRGPDLLDRIATQHDLLARRLLTADPAAARAHWEQAAADAPDGPAHHPALREAALREAAHLLLTRRDDPDARAAAATALALADSLPAPDGPGTAAREGRLRAALALAGGSARDVDALLGPADGPRELHHRAAAALLTGRPVRAVALLAPVEPDPEGDPGTARLRALLAERAGNGPAALDWYRRFLDNPVPGTAPAEAAPCAAGGTAGCTAAATDTCGGCGREGCADHLHRPEDARTSRCGHCAGPALAAVLDCALRTGLPEEGERTLAAWAAVLGDGPAGTGVRRDLALLRAERGDLDAALDAMPVAASRARSAVLVRRAAAALLADRPSDAVGDLREAVKLTPDHAPATAALGTLAEHEARRHAAEGRHREAWDAYRALLLRDPAHPRLLHALGLVSYRLAATVPAQRTATAAAPEPDGEPADRPAQAPDPERVWAWAVACLVASLHLPEVWDATAGVTGRDAEPQRVSAARAALTDRLRGDLRALDQEQGRSGDDADAWTVRLGMEVRSAEAFAQDELRVARPDGGSRRLVLGPALDRLLREHADGAGGTAWAGEFEYAVRPWRKPGPFGVHPLTQALGLFDDLGPQRYLLLQGRPGAAVAALDAIPPRDPDDTRQALLREALLGQAAEHHRQQEWRAALATLTRARTLPGGPLPAELTATAADAGLRAARALLKQSDDDQSGAKEILEEAHALAPDHAEVRDNLGAAYAQLARKINNESQDYAEALVLLRKAMALAPDDPTARHFLEAALRNRANEVTALDGDLAEAADLWAELATLGDDPEYRAGLTYSLQLRSLAAALADRRAEAVDLMATALRSDADWDGGDAAAEAPRRVSVVVANHMMAEYQDRPFRERAALLRTAQTYHDSDELRTLMVNVWRSEAADDYEADRFVDAASLLEQALTMAGSAEATATVRRELGVVYGAHAVRRANARQLREARSLVAKAVAHSPSDQDLRQLKRRIDSLR